MIWSPFINNIVEWLLSLLTKFDGNVSIPDNIFDVAQDVFGTLGYFFPVRDLFPILILSFALSSVRLGFAVFRFIKGLIPTMGG